MGSRPRRHTLTMGSAIDPAEWIESGAQSGGCIVTMVTVRGPSAAPPDSISSITT
jgi:hypothetical protein